MRVKAVNGIPISTLTAEETSRSSRRHRDTSGWLLKCKCGHVSLDSYFGWSCFGNRCYSTPGIDWTAWRRNEEVDCLHFSRTYSALKLLGQQPPRSHDLKLKVYPRRGKDNEVIRWSGFGMVPVKKSETPKWQLVFWGSLLATTKQFRIGFRVLSCCAVDGSNKDKEKQHYQNEVHRSWTMKKVFDSKPFSTEKGVVWTPSLCIKLVNHVISPGCWTKWTSSVKTLLVPKNYFEDVRTVLKWKPKRATFIQHRRYPACERTIKQNVCRALS